MAKISVRKMGEKLAVNEWSSSRKMGEKISEKWTKDRSNKKFKKKMVEKETIK